jgi:hypothetical protein
MDVLTGNGEGLREPTLLNGEGTALILQFFLLRGIVHMFPSSRYEYRHLR